MTSVTVILPCLDEIAALPGVLAAVPPGWQVIVVDNGSRDGSPELARRLGARVLHESVRGYGAAVHAGLEAATTDLVAVIDCDGSLDPAELLGPVRTVLDGGADLVCGRRRVVEARAWPWHARAGNAVLAALIRWSTGVAVHDIAPVRVARRQALLDLGLTDRRCGYPLETVLVAAQRGWRVAEVDVTYRRRALGGRSKISGTVGGTLRVLVDFTAVLRQRWRPPGRRRPAAATFVVLAKAPVPGQVKTRLTPEFSASEAAALAAASLLDTLDVVHTTLAGLGHVRGHGHLDGPACPVVALTGDLTAAAESGAVAAALQRCRVVEQRGDGLGPRLAHAHVDAAGENGATVQIGMDTPQLDPAVLADAARLVVADAGPDAVLGPAEDGGWWLLALRRAADARLVAEVPMSTPDTGRLTRAALERAGLRVAILTTLRDVDEPADVALVAAAAPGSRFDALAASLGPRVVTP